MTKCINITQSVSSWMITNSENTFSLSLCLGWVNADNLTIKLFYMQSFSWPCQPSDTNRFLDAGKQLYLQY